MKEHNIQPTRLPLCPYKEVVVVGNGPSGLALSYILSGHSPVLKADPASTTAGLFYPRTTPIRLLDIDLPSVAARSPLESRGATKVGALIDQILRPGGDDDNGHHSPAAAIKWRCSKAVSHVCIGKYPPGGTWHTIDSRTSTLSKASWMELPGLPLRESEVWSKRKSREADESRVEANLVAQYYAEYAQKMELEKYLRRGVVTRVVPYENSVEAEEVEGEDKKVKPNWIVEGFDYAGRKFSYLTKYIVLACGTHDSPNYLNVPGETSIPGITHSSTVFSRLLASSSPTPTVRCPVLIVGSGLSAADAVLAALRHNEKFEASERRRIFHIFKRSKRLDRIVPIDAYPEYAQVHRLMQGEEINSHYYPLIDAQISEFSRIIVSDDATEQKKIDPSMEQPNCRVQLEDDRCFSVYCGIISIGSSADLSFLPRDNLGLKPGPIEPRNNPIALTHDFELTKMRNCYAVGPLAGDNFVRYLLGGILVVASKILKSA